MASSTVSIQVMSDLHLESGSGYETFIIEPRAPYLALLGDIGNTRDPKLYPFLETQLRQFQKVFFLLGNHEPYHSSYPASKQRVTSFKNSWNEKRDSEASRGEFVFLNQTRYDITENVTVLGCTLFSHITPEQHETVSFGLWDFYDIAEWTVEDHNKAHLSDLEWLHSQLSANSQETGGGQKRVFVMTHHSPTVAAEACNPTHRNSKISSGFASDLVPGRERLQGVDVWAFGHTHFNCDFVVAGMRVCTNQRGYYFKLAEGFNQGKVICI